MAPRNPLELGVCVNCLHIYGKMGRPWMGLLEQDLGPLRKEALARDSQRKTGLDLKGSGCSARRGPAVKLVLSTNILFVPERK